MKRNLILLAALGLSGCTSFGEMSSETHIEEFTWQSLNVTDAVQTVRQAARYPNCYEEVGPWRAITGPHPTPSSVVLSAVVWSALHYGVTYLLDQGPDTPMPWLTRLWQGVTITGVGINVVNNVTAHRKEAECERTGIRPVA